jgi:hypothetical protein
MADEGIRGLTKLVEQAERLIQHVFDEAEKAIKEGRKLDISLRDSIYISIRLAELRLGLPPAPPKKLERDLSQLTKDELKTYRDLVLKTRREEQPPKLDS